MRARGSAAICCHCRFLQNKPLMSRTQHWKSRPVLPTFQLSAIGARPRFSSGDARPTWREFTRLEMPLWMKC